MIWDKGRRGESEDSSLALHSRKQELCFVAVLHLPPVPFHTPPEASESCALFIFACLIYKEVAFRCVQARKGLRLRHPEKPYMVKAEEFFKPFLISNLFSLVVVIIVVTIRLYVHIVSHQIIILHLYTNSIRQMIFIIKALGMWEPLGCEVLQEEM